MELVQIEVLQKFSMNRFTLIKVNSYKLEEEKRVSNINNNLKKLLINDKEIS